MFDLYFYPAQCRVRYCSLFNFFALSDPLLNSIADKVKRHAKRSLVTYKPAKLLKFTVPKETGVSIHPMFMVESTGFDVGTLQLSTLASNWSFNGADSRLTIELDLNLEGKVHSFKYTVAFRRKSRRVVGQGFTTGLLECVVFEDPRVPMDRWTIPLRDSFVNEEITVADLNVYLDRLAHVVNSTKLTDVPQEEKTIQLVYSQTNRTQVNIAYTAGMLKNLGWIALLQRGESVYHVDPIYGAINYTLRQQPLVGVKTT